MAYFSKGAFRYDRDKDVYTYPGGRDLEYSCMSHEKGKTYLVYGAFSTCKGCGVKSQCTAGKEKRIKRWEHEDLLDDVENKMKALPDIMHVRKCTAEHPFGTIKYWLGSQHFVTRGLK